MKIVCDACGAKYTIPDHKLKAKQNKVRCKKCGHTIVFSAETGTSAALPATAPAEAAPASAASQWFAAVDGEQTGPLTREELFGLLAGGQVDQETLVWREGMEDWLRLADVSELEERPFAGGTAVFSSFEEPPAPPPSGAFLAAAGGDTAEVAADAPTAPPVESESASPVLLGDSVIAEALATGNAHEPLADDFLRTEAPGIKAASAAAPVFADFFAPASQAQLTGANKMVAERSEDSVLFSLATLTQSAPAVKAGAAANDASGLIDIRVLASAAAPAQGARSPVASMAAPVIPLPPRKKNTGLLAGAVVAGIAVVGLAAAVVVVATRPAPVVEAPTAPPTVAVEPAAPAPEVAAAPTPEPTAPPVEQPGSGSGTAVAAVAPEAPAAGVAEAAAAGRVAGRPATPDPVAPAAPEAAPAVVPAPEAAPVAPAAPRKTDSAVAGVLNNLRSGGKPSAPAAATPEPAAAPAPAAAPKATLTKDEVRSTIARYGSRINRCKTPETAGSTVKVSFSIDPSGSVNGAASPDGGAPGACVAGVVAGMKFKAFEGAALPITYPFKL